jgi:hypothetical protein
MSSLFKRLAENFPDRQTPARGSLHAESKGLHDWVNALLQTLRDMNSV